MTMTEEQKNELNFLSARNRLEGKLIIMKDFIVSQGVAKVGKKKYENLFEISSLGLMLIMENRWQNDEITKLRKQLNREMQQNTKLMANGKIQ